MLGYSVRIEIYTCQVSSKARKILLRLYWILQKRLKNYANKRIRQYFPSTLYIQINRLVYGQKIRQFCLQIKAAAAVFVVVFNF